MSQRVENVITQQGTNISDLLNRYAAVEQVPAVGLLAGLISESNLNEHAERIGFWPDWSEGLGQQTLLYANVGDHTASAANLKVVRDYFWQPEHAIAEAARQYGAYYRQYQDHFEAWSRYNGGPGLAWANNPNKANIRRGWNAAQLYLAAEEEPTVYMPRIDHDNGTVAGTFAGTPQGIILHGSRSGVAGRSVQAEYDGTRRYAASGIELGWSATVGDDAVSLHMRPRAWGWNARGASSHYLAVELAQPTVHDPITEGQVRALCWWIQQIVLPIWPTLDVTHLPTHAELPEGQADGKTDCFPLGDARADELRARIAARLADTGNGGNGGDGMRASQIEIVNGEIIRNLDLAIGGLDAVLATDALRDDLRTSLTTARENLTAGALPAAQTLSRNEG